MLDVGVIYFINMNGNNRNIYLDSVEITIIIKGIVLEVLSFLELDKKEKIYSHTPIFTLFMIMYVLNSTQKFKDPKHFISILHVITRYSSSLCSKNFIKHANFAKFNIAIHCVSK